MKSIFSISILLSSCLISFGQTKNDTAKISSVPITINWVDSLTGDFSFTKDWSYPWCVEKKENGRPGCWDGGCCPERCQKMLDRYKKIPKDSLKVFYQLLDTTHLFHSIKCNAWCYEWEGTDFINVSHKDKDSIYCFTDCGIATHCSLRLNIIKNICYATIDLNSIVANGNATFYCTNGSISIDKKNWAKGIMKAEFSFNFKPDDPKDPIYWKGKIYSEIK